MVAQIRLTSQLLARYPRHGRETDIPGVRVFPTTRYPYLVYHTVKQDSFTCGMGVRARRSLMNSRAPKRQPSRTPSHQGHVPSISL